MSKTTVCITPCMTASRYASIDPESGSVSYYAVIAWRCEITTHNDGTFHEDLYPIITAGAVSGSAVDDNDSVLQCVVHHGADLPQAEVEARLAEYRSEQAEHARLDAIARSRRG